MWPLWSAFITKTQGVDSSFNVNVSVRRGKMWGINLHNIHKGEVIFLFIVYLEAIKYLEAQLNVHKGPLRCRGKVGNSL